MPDASRIINAAAVIAGLIISGLFVAMYWRLGYLWDRARVPFGSREPRALMGPVRTVVWLYRRAYLAYGDEWLTALSRALKVALVLLPFAWVVWFLGIGR